MSTRRFPFLPTTATCEREILAAILAAISAAAGMSQEVKFAIIVFGFNCNSQHSVVENL
jgi:hypothetical protein